MTEKLSDHRPPKKDPAARSCVRLRLRNIYMHCGMKNIEGKIVNTVLHYFIKKN
jgi:hypothetical protein